LARCCSWDSRRNALRSEVRGRDTKIFSNQDSRNCRHADAPSRRTARSSGQNRGTRGLSTNCANSRLPWMREGQPSKRHRSTGRPAGELPVAAPEPIAKSEPDCPPAHEAGDSLRTFLHTRDPSGYPALVASFGCHPKARTHHTGQTTSLNGSVFQTKK
jgi:hypothetical protein